MAKVKKKDKDASKWKKKKWYSILAPDIFNNKELGQTTVFEKAKVLGKSLKVNLMTLTGEVRNQNVNIRFKVHDIKEDKANTEITGYILSPSFIKRVVRRRQSRIDGAYKLKTKDNKEIVIKPLFITKNLTSRSESAAIQELALDILTKLSRNTVYNDFVKSIIFYRLQLDLRRRLSKIHPLKTCEIKKMELIVKKVEE
jgi:small subunit ribosomal protein S3Ae